MITLGMVKATLGLAVSYGTGTITAQIIKNAIPANAHRVTKVCVGAASIVMSSLAGEVVVNHLNEQFDKVDEAARELLREVAKNGRKES